MVSLKAGVWVLGVRPEVLLAIHVAEGLWTAEGVPLVITAVIDGKHSTGSAHYRGCAVDLRTNNLAADRPQLVVQALQVALGSDFLVLYEGEGTPQAHCHVEYRPLSAY